MPSATAFSDAALTTLIGSTCAGICALTLWQTPLAGQGRLPDGSYQRGYEARFKEYLPGRSWLGEAWAAARLEFFNEVAEGAVLGRDGWLFTTEEFTAPAAPADLRRELRKAKAALAAQGAVLLPLLVPDKARIETARLPRPRSAAFANRYDMALDVLRREGLLALDLRPPLQAEGFLRTDTHWTPEAARLVARRAALALQDIPLERPGFVTLRQGIAPFEGDLLAFAGSAAWAAQRRPPPERIASYETAGGSLGLLGTAAPALILTGTSFSARPAFHFEGFLKSETGADAVTYAEEGQGPFTPMRNLLRLLAAKEIAPPKVVIWEIPERYLPVGDLK